MFQRVFALATLICFVATQSFASAPLWSAKLPEAIKWTQMTQMGVLLAGANTSLSGLDPQTGEILWTRDDIKKTAPFNTKEVLGTPILMVNDYSGMGTKTKMYAINLTDGKDLWSREPENGYAVGMYPIPSKNMVIVFYSGWQKEQGTGIYMRAHELSTGKKIWETQFARGNNPVVLHLVDDAGMFYAKSDLSGHQDPLVDGDNFYVPFQGATCVDLNTGAIKWDQDFKTGITLYKKAYAPMLIDGDILYASGYGVIYAIDKNTGDVKWKTNKITSGQLSQVMIADQMVLARVGGFFYNPGAKAFALDKPLMVVAYDKNTGAQLWDFRKIELGITNLLYLPQQKTVIFADGKSLVGLDSQSTGKAEETFRVVLEFTRSIGGGELASAGVKALTGGIGGLLQAGIGVAASKKQRMDIPVNVFLNDKGLVVVRGKQHVMSFDPVAKKIDWSNYFPAPGAGMFEIVVMAALTVFSTVASQVSYANGSTSLNTANNDIKAAWGRFDRVAQRRYDASKASQTQAYILTQVQDEKRKGLGVIAVDMNSGEPKTQYLFGEKQPVYTIDEVEAKLFHVKSKTTLEAYGL